MNSLKQRRYELHDMKKNFIGAAIFNWTINLGFEYNCEDGPVKSFKSWKRQHKKKPVE